LQQAVSGGQFGHPRGIFYGGAAPTWSRNTLIKILRRFLGSARRICVIDLHSGLGPKGYGETISSYSIEQAEFQLAAKIFGSCVSSVTKSELSSDLTGDALSCLPSLLPHAEVTSVALEFGTKPILEVLHALRADAWLHAFGDPAGVEGTPIKTAMLNAFYIDEPAWKGMVLGQAIHACRQAVAGLNIP